MAIRRERNMPDMRRGELTNRSMNPLNEMNWLQRNIDRMFEDVLTPFADMQIEQNLDFMPPVDIDETNTHFMMGFDLPGVSKNDVSIEVRDNQLVISGERKEEHERKEGRRRATEVCYGAFQRMFTLPASVDANKVEATFQDGVLHIAIPKVEATQPKQIPIREGKGGVISRLTGGKTEEKKEKAA